MTKFARVSALVLVSFAGLASAQPVIEVPAKPTVIPEQTKPVEPQAAVSTLGADAAPKVTMVRVPEGGLQPSVVVDSHGTVHLVSLVGQDLNACDIQYRTRGKGDAEFGPAVRVNSQEHAATGMGAMAGPRVAIGKDGTAHVVWIGSDLAEPRAKLDPKPRPRMLKDGAPLLYSRMQGTSATPQRNLLKSALIVDAGPAILATDKGRVLVFANADQDLPMRNMEATRRIFMMESTDNGETFGNERIVQPTNNGATAQVPPVATFDAKGRLQLLYRAAGGNAVRSVCRIVSRDDGGSWLGGDVEVWRARAIPSSALAIAVRGESLLGAWMTKEMNIAVGSLGRPDQPPSGVYTMPREVGPEGPRRDPVVLVNPAGFTLVAWTALTLPADATADQNAKPSLNWQTFDSEGKLIKGASGTVNDLPNATRAAGWVDADGSFRLIY